MAAAGNWIIYDTAKKLLANGGIDFDTDTIKMALVLSTYTPSLSHDEWADVSGDQHANANGYTTGGVTITGTVNNSGSTTTLSAAGDSSWTASGGSIVARYAVMYKSGSGGGLTNPVIGYNLLDTAPANVTATTGQTFLIARPASGFWTITGATS